MRALALAALLLAGPAAAQDAERGRALAEARGCGACHGAEGRSAMPEIPSLAGMPAGFTTVQLILFREGLRNAPPMPDLAKDLADEQVEDLSAYFAALPPGPPPDRGPADPAKMAAGSALVQQLRCGICHLPDFAGREQIPRLAGQREDYLAHELAAYRDNRRVGSDTQMNGVMYGVSDAEIAALAHFMAHQ